MEFQTLGIKERKLLLKALGFDIDKLYCQCCLNAVGFENCGIMPPVDDNNVKGNTVATIICGDSIMCMAWYLNQIENEEDSVPQKAVQNEEKQ